MNEALETPSINTNTSYQTMSGVVAVVECMEIPSNLHNEVDIHWQSFITESGSSARRIRCIGEIKSVVQGEVVKLSGLYHDHGLTGSYFEVRHCESRQPTETESIVSYLFYLTGEPQHIIRKFVNDLGCNPSLVLDGPENHIWSSVNGVSENIVRSCIKEWKARINNGYVLEIAEKLGIDNHSLDLFRIKIGDKNSIDVLLQKDPFLMYYHGVVPFQRCLKLAYELGYTNTSDQVFSAAVYRTLINKYNTDNSVSFAIEEILPVVFRALSITARNGEIDRLKMDVRSILLDHASEFIAINGSQLALRSLLKKEELVLESILMRIHRPNNSFPELDPDALSEICIDRFNMDNSIPVYETLINFEPCCFNLVDCPFGSLSEALLAITADILLSVSELIIICPSRNHQYRLEKVFTDKKVTVLTPCQYRYESLGDELGKQVIIYGAHNLNISDWHSIVCHDNNTDSAMIAFGDSSLAGPNGHGPVFHHLMTGRKFSDYVITASDNYKPLISRKEEFISSLKTKTGINFKSRTDFNNDLLMDRVEPSLFISLTEYYLTKVASHFNKSPHRDFEIRTIGLHDSQIQSINDMLVSTIYEGAGILKGRHISKTRIKDLGAYIGESVIVKDYDASSIIIDHGSELQKIPLNQYSNLSTNVVAPLDTYIERPVWVGILFIGPSSLGGASLRTLLTFMANCEKVVIAGDFETLDRLIKIESDIGGILCDLGFSTADQIRANSSHRRLAVNSSSANHDDSDVIEFD